MSKTSTERRLHSRTEIELSATIARVAGRPLTAPASTIDLSDGGARLLGPAGFGVGDVVRVTIAGDDLSVEHQGLIVGRQVGEADTAVLNVAFKTLDERASVDLRRLLGSNGPA